MASDEEHQMEQSINFFNNEQPDDIVDSQEQLSGLINNRPFQTPDALQESNHFNQICGDDKQRGTAKWCRSGSELQQHFVDAQFVSKSSCLVREEEFHVGEKDQRVIQQSNFTPSLHSHQQQLEQRAHFFAHSSNHQQQIILRNILEKQQRNSLSQSRGRSKVDVYEVRAPQQTNSSQFMRKEEKNAEFETITKLSKRGTTAQIEQKESLYTTVKPE